MKKGFVVVLVIVCFLTAGIFIENLKPKSLKDETFYTINSIEDTEYVSDIYVIGKESLCTFAFVNKGTSENGKDEFTITIAKVEGVLNNKYEIYVFSPQSDDYLVVPSYSNISWYPQYEVKKGENYYGSVYTGIIPSDCKRLTIDGTEAILKHYSININGKTADFIFYSCFVEQDSYPENNVKINYEQ